MLELNIGAKVDQLKSDINQAVNDTASLDVEGGQGGGGGQGQGGGLAGLARIAGSLAAIATFVSQLKPITQSLNLLSGLVSFLIFGVMIGIRKAINWVGSSAMSIWESITGLWSTVKNTVVNWLVQAWKAIKAGYKATVNWISKLPKKIWGWLKQGYQWLTSIFQQIGKFIGNKIRQAWNFITKWLSKGWNIISGWLNQVWNMVKTLWTDATKWLSKVWSNITKMADRVTQWLTKLWNTTKDRLASAVEFLKNLPAEIWDYISEGFNDLVDAVTGLAGDIADTVADSISFSNPFGGFGGTTSVDDAIIRPNGDVIKTNPRDTLIATQNPGSMGGGKVVNINAPQQDQLIEIIKRELGSSNLRGGSRL